MEGSDDPYELLGVSSTANAQEIKSAYRKLALKHHPDRKKTDEERAAATVTFAKISNAYELLSDEEKRQQFDQEKQQQSQPRRSSSRNSYSRHHSSFGAGGGIFDDFFNHHHGGFHDPFQVFEQVFQEEFGGRSGRDQSNRRSARQQFHDDFFGGSPFMQDPFFQQREQRGGMIDPFFGGGLMRGSIFGGGRGSGRDPFGDMFTSMRRQMEQDMGGMNNNHRGSGNSFSYSSTSSSSFGGFGGGESVSTTTTTRMINGKQETVTERVVRKADGTVERTINTNDDDGYDVRGAHRRALQGNGLYGLPYGSGEDGNQSEEPEVQEVPPPRGYLPWSGRRHSRRDSRRGKKNDDGEDRPTKSRKT